MRPRRAGGLGALVVVVAVLAVALRYGLKADDLVHSPKSPVTSDDAAKALAEIPKLENVTLRTSDGMNLRAWFAPGERGAVVILVHGGGGNRAQLLPEAIAMSRHGYGILAYDSRACGESDGDLVSWGDREQHDLVAALDYASSRREIDPHRIAVLGFSIGASTVAMTAARDPRPSAVILYATWSSLADEIAAKFGKLGPLSFWPTLASMRLHGVNPDNVRPIDVIGAIHPRPLLMITGTLDGDTPVPVMQRVFEAAGPPKELWIVPGADHGKYFKTAPVEYETRVVSFLDGALFGNTAKP
jgi:pimeloyl-ACP methyl ester carboxylesterase